MSSMETIVGKPGEPVRCNQFMHWWEAGAKKGTKCLCGKTVKK